MVNILLEGYDIGAEWLYNDLKSYIKPHYKVAVVAFSFRDSRVKNKDCIVMGYSAGAVIQFEEYFLSPDDDYPDFKYYKGLPYLKDFYMQVHYQDNDVNKKSVNRVLLERGKPVYTTELLKGAIVVDSGTVKPIGVVHRFEV